MASRNSLGRAKKGPVWCKVAVGTQIVAEIEESIAGAEERVWMWPIELALSPEEVMLVWSPGVAVVAKFACVDEEFIVRESARVLVWSDEPALTFKPPVLDWF